MCQTREKNGLDGVSRTNPVDDRNEDLSCLGGKDQSKPEMYATETQTLDLFGGMFDAEATKESN